MKRRWWVAGLLAAVLFQALVLAGLYGYSQYPLWVGREVRLAIKPVDPRDLFRGPYLRLNYDLDTLPMPRTGVPRAGRTVYVALQKQGRVWRAGTVTFTAPRQGLYLSGRIVNVSFDHIRVRYGIEAYFASATRARRLGRALHRGGLARVRVAPDGRAALVAVQPAGP